MKKLYKKIRKAIAEPSKWFLKATRLDKLIDLETFEHFFILGMLLHSILFIFLQDWVIMILAWVIGFGKELFDKYVMKSRFSAKGAFLTVLGGSSVVIFYYIYQDLDNEITRSVLGMFLAFILLIFLFLWYSKKKK